MSTNRLLVRWSQGYMVVESPGAVAPFSEAFFKPGAAVSEDEATTLANAVLDAEADPKESIDAVIEGGFPVDIGQTLSAQDTTGTQVTWRLMGTAYSQDREGYVTVTPKLDFQP